MKKLASYLVLLFSVSILLNGVNMIGQTDLEGSTSEFEILVNYLEENNNFINSEMAPAFISPDEVKKNAKNPKFHIIDIRSESWFEYGHIKNAVNIKASNLLAHFESEIIPADYEKIVLVCYSGQSASYFTSLLRLAGHDNVYNLKWGMSSWREDFAQNSWLKNINDVLSGKEECAVLCEGPETGSYPVLSTGETEVEAILRARLENAFATPYREYIVKSADVLENPNNYFIVNYWDEEKYADGHIPGAIHYQPYGSLSISSNLSTLPADKQIVVYSSTGQEAAYVVAYLNLIGYNAGNIAYGANSFMNKKLLEKGWDAFSNSEINMYPVIE